MRNLEVRRRIQSVEALIKETEEYTSGDIELQAHWAKYLCVVACGFLEQALVSIFIDYCRQASSDRVANYAAARLRTIQNPNAKTFLEVASAFDKDWGNALQIYLDDEGRGQAINSIVSNRHKIAHGSASDITLSRLKEYFTKAVDVLNFVESLCSGRPPKGAPLS